jgi:hypothetical protein
MTFTKDDLKRTLWTVVQAGVAAAVVILSQQSKMPASWDEARQVGIVVAVAFIGGVVAALKNLVLADGSALK